MNSVYSPKMPNGAVEALYSGYGCEDMKTIFFEFGAKTPCSSHSSGVPLRFLYSPVARSSSHWSIPAAFVGSRPVSRVSSKYLPSADTLPGSIQLVAGGLMSVVLANEG